MFCAAVVLPAFALAAPPQLPHLFYGNATNNGVGVPVNTVIIAKVGGVEKGRITVSVAGKYGGSDALDGKLLVQGDIASGAVINFYIGNNTANQTANFISGKILSQDLTFNFDTLIVSSSDLLSLISNGTFLVSGTNTSASSIGVAQTTLINAGSNSVTLPLGVVITKVGGGSFDATALTAVETAVSSLSGLGTGVVAKGALQWGLASLGLEFSTPIFIKIYVGTSLNGQTLDVVRSATGNSGWTNDGISPTTCVVTSGYCSFSATKASYYVASQTTTTTNTTTTSSGGGGGGSSQAYISPLSGVAQKIDANKDGKIDVLDFNTLMINWGKTESSNVADFNSDGKVDIFDFNLLMINWTK